MRTAGRTGGDAPAEEYTIHQEASRCFAGTGVHIPCGSRTSHRGTRSGARTFPARRSPLRRTLCPPSPPTCKPPNAPACSTPRAIHQSPRQSRVLQQVRPSRHKLLLAVQVLMGVDQARLDDVRGKPAQAIVSAHTASPPPPTRTPTGSRAASRYTLIAPRTVSARGLPAWGAL
jgi:hypothetical protein